MQAHALGLRCFRQQVDAADGRNGCEGLAPEAERPDGGKILFGADLAGRVAQERGRRVLRRDAAAVVGHAQERHPAVLDFHGDLRRPGVHSVFHQLFYGGRGPLDDLARSDQIGHVPIQLYDMRHCASSFQESVRTPTDIALISACSVMGAQIVDDFS